MALKLKQAFIKMWFAESFVTQFCWTVRVGLSYYQYYITNTENGYMRSDVTILAKGFFLQSQESDRGNPSFQLLLRSTTTCF